ncbi:MAG: hypothetical protein LBT53_02550 [Puniceicoccales bacterium]|jgi:hypothetical protein|nr:hypothetical protein [Puniceicoccales bacterium]
MRNTLLASFLMVAAAAFLGGCETPRSDDSTQPHNAPQSWEGNMPGMSGMGTSNR